MPDAIANGESVEVIVTVLEEDGLGGPRPMGLAEGEFVVPEDFDDPLPEDVLADFEN